MKWDDELEKRIMKFLPTFWKWTENEAWQVWQVHLFIVEKWIFLAIQIKIQQPLKILSSDIIFLTSNSIVVLYRYYTIQVT